MNLAENSIPEWLEIAPNKYKHITSGTIVAFGTYKGVESIHITYTNAPMPADPEVYLCKSGNTLGLREFLEDGAIPVERQSLD